MGRELGFFIAHSHHVLTHNHVMPAQVEKPNLHPKFLPPSLNSINEILLHSPILYMLLGGCL